MTIQTRSQKIAQSVLSHRQPLDKKLRSVTLSFPTMVLQSGLAQSISFASAKATAHPEYERLLLWIKNSLSCPHLETAINTCDLTHYRQLTRDVLEAALWIKRHVQAHTEPSSNQGEPHASPSH